MKTLWQPETLAEVRERAARLTPDARPAWGRMDAGKMLVHVSEQLRMALGDLQCRMKNTPLRYFPLKHLVIYVLPFPKGAPTAPELLARDPAAWEADREAFDALLDRFAARGPGGAWPGHPIFGSLDGRAWGVLAYKHLDHHLRQFGV